MTRTRLISQGLVLETVDHWDGFSTNYIDRMYGLAILTKCLFSQKPETSLVFQYGLLVVCLTFDIRKWSQVV